LQTKGPWGFRGFEFGGTKQGLWLKTIHQFYNNLDIPRVKLVKAPIIIIAKFLVILLKDPYGGGLI
jgi:hypothetical protein